MIEMPFNQPKPDLISGHFREKSGREMQSSLVAHHIRVGAPDQPLLFTVHGSGEKMNKEFKCLK